MGTSVYLEEKTVMAVLSSFQHSMCSGTGSFYSTGKGKLIISIHSNCQELLWTVPVGKN